MTVDVEDSGFQFELEQSMDGNLEDLKRTNLRRQRLTAK